MSSEHSPTPWKAGRTDMRSYDDVGQVHYIYRGDAESADSRIRVRAFKDVDPVADALFIVQAVNNHEKLVEALKKLLKLGVCQRKDHPAVSDARAVLASLERKESSQ